ncbi:MAG: 16S rRNA (cytosine(1402)-N(4))-methyltransferase RsmH [Patescibacteria group bacterium]
MVHKPVLLKEVLKILDPQPGEFFADGTVNGGGHAKVVIEKISPTGKFLGLDLDETAINKFAAPQSKAKIILINDNFKNMLEILEKEKLGKPDGLLLDLGFSSNELQDSGRGFSFLRDEPLLLTYSNKTKPAFQWLEDLKENKLGQIIKDFSEERFAFKIAKAIKKNLPIKTSLKLSAVIKSALPKKYEHGRIHPATRTFQALRIFVNDELDNLKKILLDLPLILNAGGRVAVISFHSLEDRIVKQNFKKFEQNGDFEILTKKPITPTEDELFSNSRSRSAKLRAIKKL